MLWLGRGGALSCPAPEAASWIRTCFLRKLWWISSFSTSEGFHKRLSGALYCHGKNKILSLRGVRDHIGSALGALLTTGP